MKDLFLGVPCKLGRQRLEKIIEVELTDDERAALARAPTRCASRWPRSSSDGGDCGALRPFYAFDDRQEDHHGGHGADRRRLRDRCTWPATCRCSSGPDKINAYARVPARAAGELLWVAARGADRRGGPARGRGVAAHACATRAARPVGYAKREPQVATLASRTMRWGGVLLLVFIVVHILHFTTGDDPRPAGVRSHGDDVYGNSSRASASGGSRCSTSSR